MFDFFRKKTATEAKEILSYDTFIKYISEPLIEVIHGTTIIGIIDKEVSTFNDNGYKISNDLIVPGEYIYDIAYKPNDLKNIMKEYGLSDGLIPIFNGTDIVLSPTVITHNYYITLPVHITILSNNGENIEKEMNYKVPLQEVTGMIRYVIETSAIIEQAMNFISFKNKQVQDQLNIIDACMINDEFCIIFEQPTFVEKNIYLNTTDTETEPKATLAFPIRGLIDTTQGIDIISDDMTEETALKLFNNPEHYRMHIIDNTSTDVFIKSEFQYQEVENGLAILEFAKYLESQDYVLDMDDVESYFISNEDIVKAQQNVMDTHSDSVESLELPIKDDNDDLESLDLSIDDDNEDLESLDSNTYSETSLDLPIDMEIPENYTETSTSTRKTHTYDDKKTKVTLIGPLQASRNYKLKLPSLEKDKKNE